ncbi:MAG: AMP-binding protein [Halobacteria archaeon]
MTDMNYPLMEFPTLNELFSNALDRYGDRTAARFQDSEITYGELDRKSNAVARNLRDSGVEPGDRVVLLMNNRLEYVTAMLGIVKSGGVMMPLNSMLANDDYEYMINDGDADYGVFGPLFHGRVDDLEIDLETKFGITRDGSDTPEGYVGFTEVETHPEDDSPPDVDVTSEDPVGQFYTGGTTGKPKGVVHTNGALTANAYSHLTELDIEGGDRLLLMTPLTHSAGAFLWSSLLMGAESLIRSGFDPERTLEDIDEFDVTWTFMVPTMIYQVLDHPDIDVYDTSSLDSLIYGAAPIAPSRLEEGIDVFGNVFQQFYGQTEVPNLITALDSHDHRKALEEDTGILRSAGKPCLMNQVEVLGDDGEVKSKGEGEIAVRSPYVMEEYYGLPEKTRETKVDGWIRTGDVGRKDEDGYVYLLDRKSDVIVSGGMNVYSTKVEDALVEHPDLRDAAVIGVPSDKWGEEVTAVVSTKGEVSETELIEFVESGLADYEKPKSVVFRDSLPRTPYGKVDKKQLREPYWEDEEREVS